MVSRDGSLPHTLVARTSAQGLAVAVLHYFRFRAVTKAGIADWSDPIAFLVR